MLCCGGYKARGAKACSNHFLAYDTLCALVLEELRALLPLPDAEREALLSSLEREARARRDAEAERERRARREKEKRLRELGRLTREVFERGARGELAEELCRTLLHLRREGSGS